MKRAIYVYTIASIFIVGSITAQNQATIADTTKPKTPLLADGFKMSFKEDGSSWAKINFVSQLWVTDNHNNPGTTVNGLQQNNSYQVGLRRTRITLSAQITDKVFIFGQIASDGISSLTSGSNVPIQFVDMIVDYKLIGKYLYLGGGLSGWNGLSRFSNPQVPTILGLDMPLYQQATANINDNTTRMPGVYAKGKLGRLDYRMAVNIPYAAINTPTAISQTVTVASTTINPQFNTSEFATNKLKPQVQGYFMYQFLDEEDNQTPATVGTYLGQKRVFNIGAGFRYQQNAMWQGSYNQGATMAASGFGPIGTQTYTVRDTTRTAMFLWNVDVFYDAPINKETGSAISIYAAYTNYNFGNNYIRNNNGFNPSTTVLANSAIGTNTVTNTPNGNFNPGLASFNGAGNLYPMIGTGSIVYAQAGYLLPKFKDGTQLQPYGQCMYANYQTLKGADIVWDAGVNYLIKGHHSKFSVDYQSRPVYNLSTTDYQIHAVSGVRRGQLVLQYQISF